MVGGTISAIRISNAGSGYTSGPTITVGAATTVADGDYIFNETVQVTSDSSETARVKVWDAGSRTLDVSMLTAMQFQVGEKIRGNESGAEYVILSVSYDQPNDYPNDEYQANQRKVIAYLLEDLPLPDDAEIIKVPTVLLGTGEAISGRIILESNYSPAENLIFYGNETLTTGWQLISSKVGEEVTLTYTIMKGVILALLLAPMR